jgi:hypothetical protein
MSVVGHKDDMAVRLTEDRFEGQSRPVGIERGRKSANPLPVQIGSGVKFSPGVSSSTAFCTRCGLRESTVFHRGNAIGTKRQELVSDFLKDFKTIRQAAAFLFYKSESSLDNFVNQN